MRHDPFRPSETWLHPQECDCNDCQPAHPRIPRRLRWTDLVGHMIAGLVVGVAAGLTLAMANDPGATVAALFAAVTL